MPSGINLCFVHATSNYLLTSPHDRLDFYSPVRSARVCSNIIAPMTDKPVTLILKDETHIEKPDSKDLRHKALDLVKSIEDEPPTSQLPETLLDLINQIIKPLFSQVQHSKLTTTGRKVLVNTALPASVNHFSSQFLFNEESKPLWKNGWTVALLQYILRCYDRIIDKSVRLKTIEAHFHLLVPAILHQIDDVDINYKCYGCQCLKLLCDTLYDVRSGILKRSGLMDVFIDALRSDFSLLPTLTPEDESLALYRALYPAYRSLVRARFPHAYTDGRQGDVDRAKPTGDLIPTTITRNDSSATSTGQETRYRTADAKANTKAELQADSEKHLHQSTLTLLLRHQTLHSLGHLSTGTGLGSSISPTLSAYLIAQISWIFTDMGISSTTHLQSILPLLRNVLLDPFATSVPDLLLATVQSLKGIVCVCWPRIRERWWEEVLRGCVGCWTNICDDEDEHNATRNANGVDAARSEGSRSLKHELRVLAWLLEDVVGEDFVAAKQELVGEEKMLEGLFDGGDEVETEHNADTKTPMQTERVPSMKKSMIQEL